MHRLLPALAAALLLSACAYSIRSDVPGKQNVVEIECSSLLPWSSCYDAAAKDCPSGYDELSKHWGFFDNRHLTVACKN